MSARPKGKAAPARSRRQAPLPPPPPRRSRLAGGLGAAWRSFSGLGLVLGAIFLALSLTPSLIPRSFPLQGVLAGVSMAIGYGLGVLFGALWSYLELPLPRDQIRRILTWLAAAVAAVIVVSYAWRAAEWQNSIRRVVDMPPVETARPIEVILLAAVVFVLLLLLARFFRGVFRLVERRVGRYIPVRVARVVGIAAAVVLFLLIVDGVLMRGLLRVADASFKTLDALIEPDVAPPADPMGTGSSASLIHWDEIGRTGREYIAAGPTQADIAGFLGRPAKAPIRVYAGLNTAETPAARAELALDELIRVGGFDRSVLVVTVPTGTGWMDPAATQTLEYLHGGDVATVAVQYSYLTSPLSILFEPGFSVETGRALFRTIYRHWTALPRDHRPRLYLYGLSLGAYGSEQSFGLYEVLGDPFNGALWTGSPYSTPQWRRVTDERNPGSPEWLPRFGDGSLIRFTNQENHLDIPGAVWGPMRVVYLQYASDPITFFSPGAFYREPDWMQPPRGPDVSPELRWYPAVTFLQLLLDLAIGLAVPIGHGHYYAPQHYIDAWVAVTAPPGWTPEALDRLKAHFAG